MKDNGDSLTFVTESPTQNSIPVGTRYCGDIGFLLDFHRDVDRLRTDIEVTSLYDIFFQHHNNVVVIT